MSSLGVAELAASHVVLASGFTNVAGLGLLAVHAVVVRMDPVAMRPAVSPAINSWWTALGRLCFLEFLNLLLQACDRCGKLIRLSGKSSLRSRQRGNVIASRCWDKRDQRD